MLSGIIPRVIALRYAVLLLIAVVVSDKSVLAQAAESNEPVAVMEIGGAASRSVTNHESSYGPTVAVETTAIERWLELEAGVTPLFGHHSTEWSTDLLFKKPWTLSHRAEFMIGAGPEWIHTNARNSAANSVAIEVAPDFMFWPKAHHRFGWYVEPGYEYKFGRDHEHSFAITGGLLIGVGKRR